jgi:hypothetical protein
MKPTMKRWIFSLGIVLFVALLALKSGHWQLLANPQAIAQVPTRDLPPAYATLLSEWTHGYWFWRIAYIVLSAAAVSFPALIAAGVPFQEHSKKLLAASAAAIIAITTFMQAGEKATAHEHAYVCMELAAAAYETDDLMTLNELRAKAEECSQYIDYDYLDVSNATGGQRPPVKEIPAPGAVMPK